MCVQGVTFGLPIKGFNGGFVAFFQILAVVVRRQTPVAPMGHHGGMPQECATVLLSAGLSRYGGDGFQQMDRHCRNRLGILPNHIKRFIHHPLKVKRLADDPQIVVLVVPVGGGHSTVSQLAKNVA